MLLNDTYDISIDGDVMNIKTGRVLKTCLVGTRGGYKALRLGKGKKYCVHHLVASKFLPAPTEDNLVIDHIDRNKHNNHASNLRWVSRSVNSKNTNMSLISRPTNKSGEHHIITTDYGYSVIIRRHDIKHYSRHDTLIDAIRFRDTILERYAMETR